MAKRNPRLLIGSPEIIFGLNEGAGNLQRYGINYSNGGLAPVKSAYAKGLIDAGDFEVGLAIPKWESSLEEFNDLTRREIREIQPYIESDNFYMIEDASFSRVPIKGTNTKMYDDSDGFTATDRAIAFSRGISNYVLSHFKPDLLWVPDWMTGPAAVVAKSRGIKVVTTGHNIFTKFMSEEDILRSGIDMRNYNDVNATDWIWSTDGKFDFMASSVNASDDFTTVSPGFLERILDGSFDGNPAMSPSVIQAIKLKAMSLHEDGRSRVHGYLNPLEHEKSDMLDLYKKEGMVAVIAEQKSNELALRAKLNELVVHGKAYGGFKEGGKIVVFPNRLFDFQKRAGDAIDWLAELAVKHDFRYLIMANGDSGLEEKAKAYCSASKGYGVFTSFDKSIEELVKRSDNVYGLLTSDFEPCGGPNLNYPLEGTWIVGHSVDGIGDTVKQWSYGKGNGFPYKDNNKEGVDYGLTKMNEFASLPAEERYPEYFRVAEERLNESSTSNLVRKISDEVFLPLIEEKYRDKK